MRLVEPGFVDIFCVTSAEAARVQRQHLETMRTMALQLIRTHIIPVRGERF